VRDDDLARYVASSVRRGHPKFIQHAVAQSFGVVLPCCRERNNPVSDDFIGEVVPFNEAKRHLYHFECEAHDADRFRVEVLAI
jgi:hypothetical protein